MDLSLTRPCPHCGQKTLTLTGMVIAESRPNDPQLAGIPAFCECEAARAEAAAHAAEAEAAAHAAEKEKWQRNLKASGLPAKYAAANGLATWQADTAPRAAALKIGCAIGAALRSGQNNGRGLYISGDIGTGKTHLASALLHDLLLRGIRCKWTNAGTILREIRDTYGKPNACEEEVIARYTRIPVLAIDDLGKERPTEWALEQLFCIINARYESELTTICTSNYTLAALAARLTPANGDSAATAAAIADRLAATSYPVHLSGQSRRAPLTIPL